MFKRIVYFAIFITLTLFQFGCWDLLSADEEEDKQYQTDVINAMEEMDQLFTEEIPIDDRGRIENINFPDFIPIETFSGEIDTTIFSNGSDDELDLLRMFVVFSQIKGKFEYVNNKWEYNSEPADSTIISFQDVSSAKFIKFVIISNVVSSDKVVTNFDLFENNIKTVTIKSEVTGSDLVTPGATPVLSKVIFEGEIFNPSGPAIKFSNEISVSEHKFTLTVGQNLPVVFITRGDSFLTDRPGDLENETHIITYNDIEIYVDDPDQVDTTDGDFGDLFFRQTKVADLFSESGKIYIVFPDDRRENFQTLMPNFYNYVRDE